VPRPAATSPADLTEALVRVVAGHGLDAVSIRSVAREAGVSLGTVQYHFATKDQLLLAAYRRVIDDVTARARKIAARAAGPAAYIRALLHELLPLDDRREAELRVAVAFTARSVHSPSLTELYTDGYRALTGAIAGALQLAIELGEAAPGVDPRRDATHVVALADGLAWHLLCAPSALTPADAIATLDTQLDRLLPGVAGAPEPS
jgi:TetR/AcrR family transcriptional regulator, transcriptional repressor of bet genes